jgi:hypothetical protein
MDEAKARVYAAAALSPLSILIALPVGGTVFSLIRGEPLEIAAWVQAAEFVLVFAYPTMLLIGLPSYLALRRFRLDTFWAAILVGYLAAACVPVLLRFGGIYGVPPSNLSYWLNPFFFLGPVVGFVFWWVAKPRPAEQP